MVKRRVPKEMIRRCLTEEQLDGIASEWFLFGPSSTLTESQYVRIMKAHGREPEYTPHPNCPKRWEKFIAEQKAK